MTAAGVVRVALLDAEPVIRHGLRLLIEQDGDLTVVAEWSSLEDVQPSPYEPHVVVTDLVLPDSGGSGTVACLRERLAAAVVVLSAATHPSVVKAALSAGAVGYVLRSGSPADLRHSIRAAARGGSYVEQSVTTRLQGHGSVRPGHDGEPLTTKEEAILRLIALGHTHYEVADLLGVSVRTVENHHGVMARKVGQSSRADLVRLAHHLGLIELREWPMPSPFRPRERGWGRGPS
jgi:DNA-binding NarL/FixJ family response regulator